MNDVEVLLERFIGKKWRKEVEKIKVEFYNLINDEAAAQILLDKYFCEHPLLPDEVKAEYGRISVKGTVMAIKKSAGGKLVRLKGREKYLTVFLKKPALLNGISIGDEIMVERVVPGKVFYFSTPSTNVTLIKKTQTFTRIPPAGFVNVVGKVKGEVLELEDGTINVKGGERLFKNLPDNVTIRIEGGKFINNVLYINENTRIMVKR
jgi:hypothetical protein